jgi:hypothetical protein
MMPLTVVSVVYTVQSNDNNTWTTSRAHCKIVEGYPEWRFYNNIVLNWMDLVKSSFIPSAILLLGELASAPTITSTHPHFEQYGKKDVGMLTDHNMLLK